MADLDPSHPRPPEAESPEPDEAARADARAELVELAAAARRAEARRAEQLETGPAGEPDGYMTGDVTGVALVRDNGGDRWVRRPDGWYELVGGPVYEYPELAREYGPLLLLGNTPADPAPAVESVLPELVAGPAADWRTAALDTVTELVRLSGRPVTVSEITRITEAVGSLVAEFHPDREATP